MANELKKVHEISGKMAVLKASANLLDWDIQTSGGEVPEQTAKYGEQLLLLQRNLTVSRKVKHLVEGLEDSQRYIHPIEYAEGKELKRIYDSLGAVSAKDYRRYTEAGSKALEVWMQAKKDKDFSAFEKVLEQMIAKKKRIAEARAKNGRKPYDVLLADYEDNFDCEKLDMFFGKLKQTIFPILRNVRTAKAGENELSGKNIEKAASVNTEKTDETDMENGSMKQDEITAEENGSMESGNRGGRKNREKKRCDIIKQQEFCRFLSEYIGFDYRSGRMGVSEHPFTTSLHRQDVRWTNHYCETDPMDAVFSALHESGHGIYEQNIAAELSGTVLATAASWAMHEAQARLFENFIGREEAFWEPVYPKLQELLGGVYSEMTLRNFCSMLRIAKPGPVRTAADELTYPVHIIIRYELEKALFDGDLKVKELPAEWNRKYKEYLGVEPKDDAEGVLQDIHWASGEFGYFPSYNIGNAIAAQIYAHMKAVFPVEEYLRKGNLKSILSYLTSHIYRFGMLKTTDEIMNSITGEPLNTDYYIGYLQEHYNN